MKGIDSLAVLAGFFFLILGGVLLVVSVFVWPVIFYAVPIFIIGVVILLTLRQQEYVEPIKNVKRGRRQ